MIIKYFLQIIHPQQRIFTVLVLIIILSLSACITLGCQTSVSPTNVSNTTIPTEKPETPSNSLPTSVTNAVLEAASKLISLPISQLKIIEAEQQTWPDGCLGISSPDTLCTQALVPGWRVTVEAQEKSLIYRTNDSGSVVKLETNTAQLPTDNNLPNTVNLVVQIPQEELPSPLAKDTVFRAIASGGITGRTYETTLLEDGQVMRVLINPNGTNKAPQVSHISSQEVQEFQQLLEKVDFAQFNQLGYPPPTGAADYVTVIMTSQAATTSYADMVQHQLPESLQTVIQAWNQIAKF
ncbi:MAG: hypothetical protein F6K14_19430 [Symploca sp. SIO2C1]|nr:hypothetical protein [Symploca sp. SIO2C1]